MAPLCPHFDSKSLACRFRVIVGSLTTNPSRSLLIITWHPNRDVSVRPKARSNMSFSSSEGSSILSNMSGSSTITWQVEQAQEPPQAPIRRFVSHMHHGHGYFNARLDIPSISRSLACAISSRLSPSATCNFTSLPSLSTNVTLILLPKSGQSCLLIDRDSEGLTPRRAWAA